MNELNLKRDLKKDYLKEENSLKRIMEFYTNTSIGDIEYLDNAKKKKLPNFRLGFFPIL